LEPTTFPIAISEFFLYAAIAEAANSGKLVPIATIVNQITLSEIPQLLAIPPAEYTNKSHHHTSQIIQRIIKNIFLAILELFDSSLTPFSLFFDTQNV